MEINDVNSMSEKNYKKFYETEVWKEAFSLVQKIYTITKNYPKEERFGLTDQTRRSSNSVCANIAEAHGRYYYADKIRVLYTVRGEIEETQSHLMVAFSQKYIDETLLKETMGRYEKLKIRLNNQITDLHRQKGNE